MGYAWVPIVGPTIGALLAVVAFNRLHAALHLKLERRLYPMLDKQRIIQESVPGKQVTLAHVLANPKRDLYSKLGLDSEGRSAVGILTITPGEAAIIAGDMASKAANVHIEFIDRFSGAVLISGDVSSVEVSLSSVLQGFSELLQFSVVPLTRS